jgi:hypothetical protein
MAGGMYQYNSHDDGQDCVSIMTDRSGANTTNYTLERRTRDFNTAMDMYFGWAFEVDGRWAYDDVNETTPPIDTQNIVSGTNRYKFSDFTEKVIRLIKLEALDSDGNGIELKPEHFNEIGSLKDSYGDSGKTFQELYINADSGTPSYYCKYGDFVYLRPNPYYSEADGLVAYFNRPATHMTSTDTTDIPGIVDTHIPMVCELAANMWKLDKGLMSLGEKISFEERAKDIVQKHFSNRGEETRSVIKARIKSFR